MFDRTDPEGEPTPPEIQLELRGLPTELPLRVQAPQGGERPFRVDRLASSLVAAGTATGTFGEEIAVGVARAVGLYLLQSAGTGDVVEPARIRASVVRVLEDMGYRAGAEAYRRSHPGSEEPATGVAGNGRVRWDGPDTGEWMERRLSGTTDPLSTPESIELSLAESLIEDFAVSRLLRGPATEALRRGFVSTRGLARLNGFHGMALDAEGLKLHGATAPDPDHDTRPARNPVTLGRLMADQAGWLSPFVYGGIAWRDLNHALAAMAPEGGEDEYRAAAQVLIVEATRGLARMGLRRPELELGLSWDAPTSTTCGGLVTSDGTTIDPSDVLAESRQVFVAFLDCLAKTNTSTSARSRVAVGVDLSPYFFGAPESGHALRRLGEIAAGPLSLTIRYATPEPELLPADDRVASPVLLGQHVAIDPGRDPDVAGLGDAGRGSLERAIHAAADLHAAKHGWLERIASRREGPFAMLQGVYGRSRWLDLNALSYGVDLAPSVGTDGELAREVVDTCARWRETLGLNVVPYGLGGAEAVPLGENEEALERIRRLADRYQPYPTPRPARFRLDDGANAEDVGALIRDAFLTTGCRSLTLV